MVAPVKFDGMGVCGRQGARDLQQSGGAGGATIRFGDVGEVPTPWEDAGRILSPGDTTTDGAAAETEGGWEMGLTTSCGGNVGSMIGGGEYICRTH